jgi:hypothetical protein
MWKDEKLIYPGGSMIPMYTDDLPEDCQAIYLEARNVFPHSARAAAALLRLCIELLVEHLGEKAKDLNTTIANMVKNGLDPVIQKALDICRVVGNNAVHPGEIAFDDSPEIAIKLFDLVNYITEDRITKPKRIKDLYESLPEKDKEHIDIRDRPKSGDSR